MISRDDTTGRDWVSSRPSRGVVTGGGAFVRKRVSSITQRGYVRTAAFSLLRPFAPIICGSGRPTANEDGGAR